MCRYSNLLIKLLLLKGNLNFPQVSSPECTLRAVIPPMMAVINYCIGDFWRSLQQ